jgi:ATP-dependent protease HslVU (ClpYQ) peptidase subunit
MTVIAGIRNEDHLILAADSCGVVGNEIIYITTPKVFSLGRCIVGVSGSYRLQQIVQYLVPMQPPKTGQLAWFVRKYSSDLRAAAEKHGGLDEDKEIDGKILIGCDGVFYRVDSCGAIVPLAQPYASIGSGSDYALGVIHASYETSADRASLLHQAIRVAIDLDPYSNGETYTVRTSEAKNNDVAGNVDTSVSRNV